MDGGGLNLAWRPRAGSGAGAMLVATVLVLTLVATACGGSENAEPRVPGAEDLAAEPIAEPTSSGSTPAAGTRDAQDILVDFTECLRDEGFAVPDPDFSLSAAQTQERLAAAGIDTTSREFEAAIEACEPLLAGILQQIPTDDLLAFAEATVDYSECMRENGIDLPDPDFTQGLSGLFGNTEIDTSDPAFAAADRTCQRVFEDLPDLFGSSS